MDLPSSSKDQTELIAGADPARAHELLLAWYGVYARDLPWRHISAPYATLVSEIMLQQTQVERVIPKYLEFLDRFPTLAALAEASTADVIRAWAPLGYNRRAVNLQRLAREVVEHYNGLLPADEKALRALPGIGHYTAAAVACFAFGQPTVVVDTNVRRVLGRLQGQDEIGLREAERLAQRYLPLERAGDWSQALMDLSATICRASSPACLLCPLRAICPSSGRAVHEHRARYQAKPPERFRESDRYLRGRIIDLLREAPAFGVRIAWLAATLSLNSEAEHQRLARLLHGLERDGLVVAAGQNDQQVRLPD